MEEKKSAVIVDPYSSGALFAAEFKALGYRCIMVPSSACIPPIYRGSHQLQDFDLILSYREDIGDTVAILQRQNVRFVVAGCEPGVELAEALCARLGVPGNRPDRDRVRRDKFAMAQAVSSCGLNVPPQFCSDDLGRTIEWARANGAWPVVLKPLQSCASDNVHLCRSEADVKTAFERIVGGVDVLGAVNKKVLAQQFVRGTEYVVDTVSWNGLHKVVAFWKYGKRESQEYPLGYDCLELLPDGGERQGRLSSYIKKALDALGIKYGPAHCEVVFDGNQIKLLEVGARLHGGRNPLICRECGGPCQVKTTVEALVEPRRFTEQLHQPYALRQGAMLIFLNPLRKGRLRGLPGLPQLKGLRSFNKMHIGVERGQRVSGTVGWVVLTHRDKATLDDDYRRIKRLAEDGLCDIE